MQHVLPNPQVQRLTALTAALVIGGLGGAGIAIVANNDGPTQGANIPAVSVPSQVSVFPESATASQASQRSVPSQVAVFPESATASQSPQPAQGQQFGGRLP
jgi:hypothetical protein